MEDAVGYYHSLERFGVRPGLKSIKALCRKLGDPQKCLRCVHVAGTNGKGSTCTEIASVLTSAGYRTGLYTSPYVLEFRERIRIDGQMIPDDALSGITDVVKKAADALAAEGIIVTEFEAVTAAAFLYFFKHNCDVVVLETGLGGRFDATNVIEKPLCSVITSVSMDHTNVLGPTLEQIAYEKCGIIKRNAAVITTVTQQPSVLRKIREAASICAAELILADPSVFRLTESDIGGSDIEYRGLELRIPFSGMHQLENASLTISAIEFLKQIGYYIDDKALADGLSSARIPARTEIINRSPLVILDGCHNDGSTAALASILARFLPGKQLLAVMGMMADKDCERALSNLLPLFSKVFAVTPSNPRSMPAQEFGKLIARHGVPCDVIDDPVRGVLIAARSIEDYDGMVVCGSLYLAADVRTELIRYYKESN